MSAPAPVPVPRSVLDGLGCDALVASFEAEPSALGPLLGRLAAERCGHTWRTWLERLPGEDPTARVAAVLARERTLRPTEVWTYSAVRHGVATPVAVATVSARIRVDFPHDGYPVLARAYVAPAARGKGLYRCMVAHRLERCRQRYGDRLMAVHLGAADRPVERALGHVDLGLRFVHVGDEQLPVAGRPWTVRDFVAFTRHFHARIPADLPDLRAFVEQGTSALGWGALRPRLVGHPAPVVRELVDLLDTMGVQT